MSPSSSGKVVQGKMYVSMIPKMKLLLSFEMLALFTLAAQCNFPEGLNLLVMI
jgi:hypothetical protein